MCAEQCVRKRPQSRTLVWSYYRIGTAEEALGPTAIPSKLTLFISQTEHKLYLSSEQVKLQSKV